MVLCFITLLIDTHWDISIPGWLCDGSMFHNVVYEQPPGWLFDVTVFDNMVKRQPSDYFHRWMVKGTVA